MKAQSSHTLFPLSTPTASQRIAKYLTSQTTHKKASFAECLLES